MDLRHLVFILLFYTASGFFLSMGLLSQKAVGRRYFLYHGLGAAVLLGSALFALGPHEVRPFVSKSYLWLVAFCVFYSLTAGKRWWWSTGFFAFGAVATLYVLIADLLTLFGANAPNTPHLILFITNALLSLGLLGVTMGAMLVGHWYLVVPKLSIGELKRTTLVFILLVGLRFLFGTYMIAGELSGKTEVEIWKYLFSGYPGLFITMRWAWGLLAPLLLCPFIWKTVSMRSTQSATGILYVAVLFVLAGETLSQYLTFYYRIPL